MDWSFIKFILWLVLSSIVRSNLPDTVSEPLKRISRTQEHQNNFNLRSYEEIVLNSIVDQLVLSKASLHILITLLLSALNKNV